MARSLAARGAAAHEGGPLKLCAWGSVRPSPRLLYPTLRGGPAGPYFECSITPLWAIHLTGVDAEERNGRAPA